jgi:MYXO-CTERM domain-containing protein
MPNLPKSLPLWSFAVAAILVSASAHAAADAGCSAAGPLASALPARLLFGIASGSPDDSYAKKSGTDWDVQWLYLSGQHGNDWYNSWGGGSADGSFALDMFQTIDQNGFIPGVHLYNMGYGHDGGDSGLLTEIQDVSWATNYFTEFKALMQRAKTFGKPVIIVLEGDSFGMLEILTNNKPDTAAAVASTGLSELASLPNTIAGFGMAYLALRKSVGASNVMMGPDVPYYAANGDIMNYQTSDDLAPHRDYQWKFFGPWVGANATGDRMNFMASAPQAADCGYYQQMGDDRCWDPSDAAPVNSKSINRYLAWLGLMNQQAAVPWVLHQFPFGNSQLDQVHQDNRAEYLLQYESPASEAIRAQHLANFANSGVIGFLFGSSDDDLSPTDDIWKDQKPFLATHVAAVNNAGGFPITRSDGAACTASGSGGSDAAGGTTGTGGTTAGTSSGNEAGQAGDNTAAAGTASGGRSSGSGGSSGGRNGNGTGGSAPSNGGSDNATGGSGTATGGTSVATGSSGNTSGSAGRTGASGSATNGPQSSESSKESGGCAIPSAGAPSSSRWLVALVALGLYRARRRRSARGVVT